MNTTTCKECGHEIEFGQWPICPHGEMHEANAARFDPIVVWQSTTDQDRYSVPGDSSEACPTGYRPIEIRTLREADKFIHHYNGIERDKEQMKIYAEQQYWDQRTRDRRADIDARVGGNNPKAQALAKQIRAWADKKRDARYGRLYRKDPEARFQVFANDSSNRSAHSSERTGYRDVKR